MKYVDEFRDGEAVEQLLRAVREQATRRWVLMEVCGGQTHNLLRYGIDEALQSTIELIHGPGCPVCVTPAEVIDQAIEIAFRPDTVLASFGDMLRVPGHRGTLQSAKMKGANLAMVYSPLDAVEMARRQPATKIVFFAVGFETTAPATALAVRQAAEWGLDNFRLLAAHVRVLPAMVALARQPDCRVEAFLAAGHVCTVTGYHDYQAFVDRYTIPVVVTGFEPVDLLQGILGAVRQLERGEARVENAYPRSVREHGNASARQLVDEIFVPCDAPWRGLGVMPGGGLRMRPQWQRFDASADPGGEATALPVAEDGDSADCRAADVLLGQIKPPACPLFGRECTPDSPRGAPMVSSEGACAAYFRFRAAEVGGGDHGV